MAARSVVRCAPLTSCLCSDRIASMAGDRHGGSCLMVLVHGWNTPSHCYDTVFQSLAKAGHRVVTYDLWGRGWSDAPSHKQCGELFTSQLAVRYV